VAKRWYIEGEESTVALGQAIGSAIAGCPGVVTVFLQGNLGAGKTTLTRGVLRHFGHSGPVKSPTYTLVEAYELPARTLYHFDLYRLGDPEELEYMGIRDYFANDSVCLLEWPERGTGYLPAPDLTVEVLVDGSGRQVNLLGDTATGRQILEVLPDSY
jgi:tRNA threonylcarbamoyladenosine biosynthesis protein TsaE